MGELIFKILDFITFMKNEKHLNIIIYIYKLGFLFFMKNKKPKFLKKR